MTRLHVNHEVLDDDLLYRKTKIQCGDISITTPINSTDTKIIHSQINEIYKKINFKDLDSAIKSDESPLFNKFKYSLTEGSINFPIVNYDDTVFPENKNMEMLADLCYEAGDVIVTPSWTSLLTQYEGEELIIKLNDLNNSFIERVKKKNNKTIVGLIPNKLPRFYLDDLLKVFFENDIFSFIVDCNGKSIDSGSNKTWMRNLLLILDTFKEEGFLYSINSYEGRFSKNSYATAAKDYISHGYGIDILGLNHIPPKLPESIWKEIEMKNDRTYKVFDRETYGYKRLLEDELKEFGQINIENSEVPDLNKLRRVCNISEKNREDQVLKQYLEEEQSVKKHVSKKVYVDPKFLENTEKIKKHIQRN